MMEFEPNTLYFIQYVIEFNKASKIYKISVAYVYWNEMEAWCLIDEEQYQIYNNQFKPMELGIQAIQIYIPSTFVDQHDLEKYSSVPQGKYTIGLGQLQLSFTHPQEDANSMALTVVRRLLQRNSIHPSQVGRLQVGTETLVDKSKSTKTVLMSLFGDNHDIEGATSINACYGATNALLNTLNWMGCSTWDGRYGIVVATDVAVYEQGPARPTGGAGAVAMLISNRPKIVLSPTRSSFIDNQYDFYKPIPSSQYPVVDGKVSMDCYINAMKNCYSLQKIKTKQNNIVQASDYLCFHTPFYKMIQKAYDALVKVDRPNAPPEQIASEFKAKVEPTLYVSKRVGNIYTGSLYASLLSLLYRTPNISNKSVTLFSYGSGLCATLMQARIIENPLSHQQITDINVVFNSRIRVEAEDYSKLMKAKQQAYGKWKGKVDVNLSIQPDNSYYLDQIDQKWRRVYRLKEGQSLTLAKYNIQSIARINAIDKLIPHTQQNKSFHLRTISERKLQIDKKVNQQINWKLYDYGGITCEQGDKIIENVVGKLSLPIGVLPMIMINNKKYTVPMCIEEPSVLAAASSIGKFIAPHSFITSSSPSMMIGQVHLVQAETSDINQILKRKQSIIYQLNKKCQSMVKRGGGVKDIAIRELVEGSTATHRNYSLDILINVCDAMGANITNTLAESAKQIISFMGIKTGISILSNYCVNRKSTSKFMVPVQKLSWKGHTGLQVAERVIQAYKFAKSDVFRAVTHNKGIMNGIDAVCLATGQDWRAIQSAAHAYASRKGRYEPLTHYEIKEIDGKKYFMGLLELPIAVGTIGGTVVKNSLYKQNFKIMGNPSTQELAEIIVTVGLAQNFGALRAMVIEGIQKGHMWLHARSVMSICKVSQDLQQECYKYMKLKNKFDEGAIVQFLKMQVQAKL